MQGKLGKTQKVEHKIKTTEKQCSGSIVKY